MEKIKQIHSNNLPTRLPIVPTAVALTALKVWEAPEWLWGVIGLWLVVWWAAAIFVIATRQTVDIFKDGRGQSIEDIRKEVARVLEDCL